MTYWLPSIVAVVAVVVAVTINPYVGLVLALLAFYLTT